MTAGEISTGGSGPGGGRPRRGGDAQDAVERRRLLHYARVLHRLQMRRAAAAAPEPLPRGPPARAEERGAGLAGAEGDIAGHRRLKSALAGRYGGARVGHLRLVYGARFGRGLFEQDLMRNVLHVLDEASLRQVARDIERGEFEDKLARALGWRADPRPEAGVNGAGPRSRPTAEAPRPDPLNAEIARVEKGERDVDRQRERVAELEARGMASAGQARRLLSALEESLTLQRQHLAYLRRRPG